MARQIAFNREQAVEQVMLKIWTDGFHSASVKSLSELLGITRSSFYNTFGSREALFKEVLSAYINFTPLKKLQEIQKGEAVLPMLSDALKQLCKIRAQDTQQKGCLAMNSVAELCGGNDALACHMRQQLELSNSKIEELLSWAKDQGEISQSADVQALALSVSNLFAGLNIMSKAINEEHRLWLAASTTLKGLGLYRCDAK